MESCITGMVALGSASNRARMLDPLTLQKCYRVYYDLFSMDAGKIVELRHHQIHLQQGSMEEPEW